MSEQGWYWVEYASGQQEPRHFSVQQLAELPRGLTLVAYLPEAVRALNAGNRLLSCILSVRTENTNEWMNGIAEDCNAYAEVTGEPDRVLFDGDGLRISRANAREVAG